LALSSTVRVELGSRVGIGPPRGVRYCLEIRSRSRIMTAYVHSHVFHGTLLFQIPLLPRGLTINLPQKNNAHNPNSIPTLKGHVLANSAT